MDKTKLIYIIIIILLVAGLVFVITQKGCNEKTVVTFTRDSIDQNKVDSLEEAMKIKDDSIHELNKKIDTVKEKIVINHTIYIEKEKAVVSENTDSVNNEVTGRLNNFDTGTKYDSSDYKKKYTFNGVYVKKIKKSFLRLDYVENENELLYERIDLTDKKLSLTEGKLSDALAISELKEKMIIDLEKKPHTVINKTKWYVFGAIIIGSISLGYTAGKVIK